MSIIIDLNAVCLVCLQDGEVQFQSIYECDAQTQLPIVEMISSCAELHLPTKDNKLPDKICARCLGDLDAAWRFRQNCEAANTVFDTIQQQEDEAEELAKFEQELEQQKIKLPTGLKIKRVLPQSKTLLVPMQVEHIEDEDEETQQQEENELEQQTENDIVDTEETQIEDEDFETQRVIVEETCDDNDDDDMCEQLDYADYYEGEEILEDEDELVQEVETTTPQMKKVETFVKHVKTKEEGSDEVEMVEVCLEEELIIKEEKLESENENAEISEQQHENESPKRRRGRPRKTVTGDVAVAIKAAVITKVENTDENRQLQSNKSRVLNKAISCVKNSTAKAPLTVIKTARMKKSRNVLDPETRPSKICEICGNIYKYQHALNAHMRRHNNDRPYACEFCERAFVSAVELRRHMRVHTGHKPYACQYCDRRFSDFGSKVKHERTHTGERPYRCTTCAKSFAYAHVLSVHLRTHTGEKKFQCTRCGKGFTKKAYLQTHMEQHARASLLHVDDLLYQEKPQQQQKLKQLRAQPQQQQEQQEHNDIIANDMSAIKNVALEYIVSTVYIDDNTINDTVDNDDDDDGIVVVKRERTETEKLEYESEEVDDHMTEEHLEDSQYPLNVRKLTDY